MGFLHSSVGKESACNAGDPGSIPGLGRSPGEGNGNTLQYSCLENPMDRGAWWATSPWGRKSRTRLSAYTTTNEGQGQGHPFRAPRTLSPGIEKQGTLVLAHWGIPLNPKEDPFWKFILDTLGLFFPVMEKWYSAFISNSEEQGDGEESAPAGPLAQFHLRRSLGRESPRREWSDPEGWPVCSKRSE